MIDWFLTLPWLLIFRCLIASYSLLLIIQNIMAIACVMGITLRTLEPLPNEVSGLWSDTKFNGFIFALAVFL